MPTEHEYKYVLDLDTDEAYFKEECKKHLLIQQGYLAFSKGMTCRVRSSQSSKKSEPKWYLTFKQKVKDRVIEVEQRIDERDGLDLWSVCVGRLKKDRYVIPVNGNDWEVDFFNKGGHRYFVMSEVELEEGSPRIALPSFIQKNLLHEVDLTDDRFGNKRLADVEHASNMYSLLAKERQNEIKTNKGRE